MSKMKTGNTSHSQAEPCDQTGNTSHSQAEPCDQTAVLVKLEFVELIEDHATNSLFPEQIVDSLERATGTLEPVWTCPDLNTEVKNERKWVKEEPREDHWAEPLSFDRKSDTKQEGKCTTQHIFKMATRRRRSAFLAREAIELVLQEGSDEEPDVVNAHTNLRHHDDDDAYIPDDDGWSDMSSDSEMAEEMELDDSETETDNNSTENGQQPTSPARQEEAMVVDNTPHVSDSYSEQNAEYMHTWCKNLRHFPRSPEFSCVPGLQGPLMLPAWEQCKPIDFYRLFITNDLLIKMKKQTNLYARQVIVQKQQAGVHLSPRSKFSVWKDVTVEEVTNFLAILIHMGIVKKPRIVDYWSTNPVLQTVFASKIMKRERFRAILSFFHLNDNETIVPRNTPGHDPLHKVRPLLDHLVHLFKTVYIPEQNICVDEAVCPWRGRAALKVYMKDKPVKWGIKLYELCESESGYVWNLEVMCHQPGVSNKLHDVVHRLLDRLTNRGYRLFVDNYYCCPTLAHSLTGLNTAVVGTVRSNRDGMPKDLVTQRMQTGDVDYRRLKDVAVLRWKDKRDVYVLTTDHRPNVMVQVRSRSQNKLKPKAVVDYIGNMAGVDRSSQMVAYLPMHRKTIKWWKKLTFHLLTLTMIQAHCLYLKLRKQLRNKPVTLEAFATAVCQDLVKLPPSGHNTGAAVPAAHDIHRLIDRHFMMKSSSRICHVCYAKAKAQGASREQLKNRIKRTSYMCRQCQKHLCVAPCMEIYHTKECYTD